MFLLLQGMRQFVFDDTRQNLLVTQSEFTLIEFPPLTTRCPHSFMCYYFADHCLVHTEVADMKLELLLALAAVAVLAPNLAQGRIVSKCELKEKLGAALSLNKDLQTHKEHILAIG